jgi:hypothetical protein
MKITTTSHPGKTWGGSADLLHRVQGFSLPAGLYSMPLHGKLILPLIKEEDSMTVSEPPGRVGSTPS